MVHSERARPSRNSSTSVGCLAISPQRTAPPRQRQRALPRQAEFVVCEQTIYGWFRKGLDLGLFDRLLGDVARRRRRTMGRRAKPRQSLIDTQAVKGIPVRGPRGYDAAKKGLGRKRVALVEADGTWLAVAVVRAIAWHLRVGGSWRALPGTFPAWRTV